MTEDIVTRAFGEVTPVDQSLWSTLLGWVGRMAEMMRYDEDHIVLIKYFMIAFDNFIQTGENNGFPYIGFVNVIY